MKTLSKAVTAVRWLARALAICVFLFWGAFFIEHLREWFIKPFPNHPPLKVCVGMALHCLLLAGLLIALKWERVGSLMVILAAFVFFYQVSGSPFSLFFGLTALPPVLLLCCGWRDRETPSTAAA